MNALLRDLRSAARAIARRPGVPLLMVLTLALGIGANTAIFNLINALVLRPLPYDQPERLVALHETQRAHGSEWDPISTLNLRDWRRGLDELDAIGAFSRANFNVGVGSRPVWVEGARVEASLFPLLGVQPPVGRTFSPDEDRPNADRVVLLSHALWQRQYSGDDDVVGRSLRLDGVPHTIVGVMPERFAFPESAQLWTPLALDWDEGPRDARWLNAIGRLAPGTGLVQAQAALDTLAEALAARHPDTNRGIGGKARPLAEELMPREARAGLVLMLGAAGFVLLLICANLVSLLTVRVMSRWREYALRASLGARRWQLIRQLLLESVFIAVLGGVLAVVCSVYAVDLMLAAIPVAIPFWVRLELDTSVLVYTLGVAVVSGVLFGLLPALRVTSPKAMAHLREDGRGSMGKAGSRLRSVLVIAELAVCGVLLVSSLLLARSFYRMQDTDRGYQSDKRVTLQLALTSATYDAPAVRQQWVDNLLRETRALAGIEAADVVDHLPTSPYGFDGARIAVEDRPVEPGDEPIAARSAVTQGYFDTLSIPVRTGRAFTVDEVTEGRPVAVISASLAEQLWPERDPLGRRLRFAGAVGEAEERPWLSVVGVVGDTRQVYRMGGLDQWPERQVYVPFARTDKRTVTLVARTAGAPLQAVAPIQERILAIDRDLPPFNVYSLEQVQGQVEWLPRFWTKVFSVFALFGLAVTAIGLYGLIANTAAQRSRELGIRLALGAVPSSLMLLPVKQGMRLAGIGLLFGIVGSFGIGRVMASALHGVEPLDPVVYTVVIGAILSIVALASAVPAIRILRLDLTRTLRAD